MLFRSNSMATIMVPKSRKVMIGTQNRIMEHFRSLLNSDLLLSGKDDQDHKIEVNSGSFSIQRKVDGRWVLLYSIPFDGNSAQLMASERAIDELNFKTIHLQDHRRSRQDSSTIIDKDRLQVIAEKLSETMISFSKVLKYLN